MDIAWLLAAFGADRRVRPAARRLAWSLQITHDGACVGVRTFLKFKQGRANTDAITRPREKPRNEPELRRRNFYDGLLGLNGEQGLISNDVLSLSDVPGNDFG